MALDETKRPRFSLGQVVATPGALGEIRDAGQSPSDFLARHAACDWGDLDDDDRRMNDEALIDGSRLLSAYLTRMVGRIIPKSTPETEDNVPLFQEWPG
jgi:hypothetical protein